MFDELKLILESLDKLGDGAFTFAIWYLAKDFATDCIRNIVILGAIWLIAKTIRACVTNICAGPTIARDLGVEPTYGELSNADIKNVRAKIARLKEVVAEKLKSGTEPPNKPI
jgi:hypothetical protein